jgi:hypothetical protein
MSLCLLDEEKNVRLATVALFQFPKKTQAIRWCGFRRRKSVLFKLLEDIVDMRRVNGGLLDGAIEVAKIMVVLVRVNRHPYVSFDAQIATVPVSLKNLGPEHISHLRLQRPCV